MPHRSKIALVLSALVSSLVPDTSFGTGLNTNLGHHRLAIQALHQSQVTERPSPKPLFWISYIHNRSSGGVIQDDSGGYILKIPRTSRSPYAPEISYDNYDFYSARQPRVAFIGNIPLTVPFNAVLSFGVDTGHESDKLDVSPSLFLGLSTVKLVLPRTYLGISFGSWVGGALTERSCQDDTSREFQCSTLLPWAERKEIESTGNIRYSGLVEIRREF